MGMASWITTDVGAAQDNLLLASNKRDGTNLCADMFCVLTRQDGESTADETT